MEDDIAFSDNKKFCYQPSSISKKVQEGPKSKEITGERIQKNAHSVTITTVKTVMCVACNKPLEELELKIKGIGKNQSPLINCSDCKATDSITLP